MDKLLLKEIISEQNNVIKNMTPGVEREALSRIEKLSKIKHAVVISGIRRSGKSTLLGQIAKKFYKPEDIYYLSFEDERLINFEINDFNAVYELFVELFGEKKIFFFDEIQNVTGWERFVRRMHDNGHKFYITGSNASLLSRELGTKLTGRSVAVELYPFSFKEYLAFEEQEFNEKKLFLTVERGKIKKYFNEYLEKGGMPEYLKSKDSIVLKKVYEDILYRDIATRYEIKEIKALRELGLYFLSNLGSLFSYNKLKQALKLGSSNTIKSYADYFENAFLLFAVNIFSYSLKRQMIAPKKIYCIDNGLANAVSFRFSKDRGKFLENLVFMELKRRNNEIYYYKTSNNLEVDFLTKKGTDVDWLIQVSQSLSDPGVKSREFKSLIDAKRELKADKLLVLTESEEKEEIVEGIKITVMPVWKWLLM